MRNQINNHTWVDLGLPSGTKWATCNVGASKPEEFGNYYAWGETTTKDYYDWDNYKYGSEYDELTKYCTEGRYGKDGFTDKLTTLEASDDAATANWGEKWRTPTKAEWQELIDNCTWDWTTLKGMKGYKVKGSNGKSIFLPAAGHRSRTHLLLGGDYWGNYWSSSIGDLDYTYDAWNAYFFNADKVHQNYDYRKYGRSVRPVLK